MAEKTRQMVKEQIDQGASKGPRWFPCSIRAVHARERMMFLENQDTGRLVSQAVVQPFDPIYYIPTSETMYVMLATPQDRHIGGIPVLFHRQWLEPELFATDDPTID